jgi:hypothetical protein
VRLIGGGIDLLVVDIDYERDVLIVEWRCADGKIEAGEARRHEVAGSAEIDSIPALNGLGALIIRQLPLAAELDAGSHSALPAFAGTLPATSPVNPVTLATGFAKFLPASCSMVRRCTTQALKPAMW